MKRKTLLSILGLALVLGALLAVPSGAAGAQGPEPQGGAHTLDALGTAFTYQGRLNDGGDMANGTYDFEFRLYDADTGGSPIGTVPVDDKEVTDGLFTVELDFGSGAFTGDARWLEIGVRPGSSTGAYTTLDQRQPLTPAPYALALPGLRTEPNATSPNVIGGYSDNSVTSGVVGATISGGGHAPGGDRVGHNTVTDNYGTIGGGGSNQAGDNAGSTDDADYATVGGGDKNLASDYGATVGGGYSNDASGYGATVSGGGLNDASGAVAMVPGGFDNTAQGDYSFAAGVRAKAYHDGSFVWADSTFVDFASTADDQFLVRANGGAVFTGTNDSTAMLNVTNLDSSPGILSYGGSHGVAGYGNIGVYGSGSPYGVYGTSTSTGVYGNGDSVGLYARSILGNPIEAYGSSTSDREFYVSNSGEVYADGTFHPGGADLAEMLPAVEGLEPGDVLVVSSDGKLTRSTQAYQPTVVGVYSTQPGFLGGAGEDADPTGKVPLAVVGVVPVKASVENGPIRPGDLLTTSSVPGHAMKAGPSPTVGTVIGKALEGLDETTGVILMLVVLQ